MVARLQNGLIYPLGTYFIDWTGFLEVNLGKPQKVGEIKLSERNRNSTIGNFEVQYLQNGKWIPVAKDDKMGEWTKTISSVTAQKFRVEILDSKGYIGINEFQLFAAKP